MEAFRLRILVAVMVIAVSAIQSVSSAVDAPAPSPTSDATTFIPAAVASVIVLAFGFLF
ncbi:arabinogalactan protein 21-like [Impatiens glandulifera]|uniref:arabinogalactan protein 21-like n=1 Tax=Impatiens glandulifera TaxID=253017 RepID=UPI001FB1044F|nr:arabinogalactan protein 21-like [Impatiens glandulifera]